MIEATRAVEAQKPPRTRCNLGHGQRRFTHRSGGHAGATPRTHSRCSRSAGSRKDGTYEVDDPLRRIARNPYIRPAHQAGRASALAEIAAPATAHPILRI